MKTISRKPKTARVEDTCELDIEDVYEACKKLRSTILRGVTVILEPEAEEFFFLALGSLEQAERFAKLALYKTRQARAAGR